MRSINNRLNWASVMTLSALVVGCALENVPVGENDGAGTGSKGSVDEIPDDDGAGTGAAGSTDADPGDPDYGTGAAGGTKVDPDEPDYGTGAAGSTDVDPDEPDYGTGAAGSTDVQDPVVTAYCEMEAACIPSCMVEEGVAPCGAPERQIECQQIELPMNSACEIAEAQWFECMAHLSCSEVQLFFAAHPDNIKPTTPCSANMDEFCDDWEPPTEYAFD